jgi:hypothetical protein
VKSFSIYAVCLLCAASAAFSPFTAVGPSHVFAAEGMWTLDGLERCPFDEWRSKGLSLGARDIFHPDGTGLSDAVIQLGGGTGSFVSPNGLILTNHHVAFGALQRQSSVASNYMKDGFLARTHADEIPALGYEAKCLLRIDDVTEAVNAGIKEKMPDMERHDKIEANMKKIVREAEKGKDIEAAVKSSYDGARYDLYTYFKIKDIRIVYAPPRAIGNYGGEEDNWMWPRHTGDFSFLRAYVGPDGKSAEYSKDNVPFKPRKHLAFSTAPLEEGDCTMVLGYPASTKRYRTSHSIGYTINEYYPRAIKHYQDVLAIIDSEARANPDAAIKTASLARGYNNGCKNNIGMLEGLKKWDLLEMKLREESGLRAFAESRPELKQKYGAVLDEISERFDEYCRFTKTAFITTSMRYTPIAMRSANTIYKWGVEREKKNDLDRDPGYQDRDGPRVKKLLELADLQYDEGTDKKVLAHYFRMAMDLPSGLRIDALEPVISGLSGEEAEHAIQAFIDKLYAGTKVTDKDQRMTMFGLTKKELMALGDPMIEFVASIEVQGKALEERTDAYDGALARLGPKLQALREAHASALSYPDANGTMRLSVGEVCGYRPRDAISYGFQTSLEGVVEKNTGEEPFDCPPALMELYEARDFGRYADPVLNDVPVCFLSTDDITGGNSGSPIFNGKGDLIGVIFDGNLEAVAADYYFMPELTRAISVDARYVLFVLDKYAGAKELLGELTIR